MQSRIVQIAEKSKQWVQSIESNMVRVIEREGQKTVDLNRSQMIAHKTADNSPLVHARTGSANLSKAYARRTGKSKPDLFRSGAFQDGMFLTMPNKKEYIISSRDHKTNWLARAYGKIFGVSESNQGRAKKINDKLVIDDYLNSVFR
jgi:hypothetical protein